MEGHGERVSRDTEAAVAALLSCRSIAAAAKKVGVNEKTLRAWLKEEAFASAYRAARRAVVEYSIAQVQKLTEQAVKALARNLRCGVPAVEVKAAVAILDQAGRGVELLDLAERLAKLENPAGSAEQDGEAEGGDDV
jgi:hypothetical protein